MTEIISKEDILEELRLKHENWTQDEWSNTPKEWINGYEDAMDQAKDIIEKYFSDRTVGSMTYELNLETDDLNEKLSEVEAEIEQIEDKLNRLGLGLQVKYKGNKYKCTNCGLEIFPAPRNPGPCPECGWPMEQVDI